MQLERPTESIMCGQEDGWLMTNLEGCYVPSTKGVWMGYTNPDKRIVNVTAREKRYVRALRRRAEKRLLHDEHPGRQALRATKRGWWYA